MENVQMASAVCMPALPIDQCDEKRSRMSDLRKVQAGDTGACSPRSVVGLSSNERDPILMIHTRIEAAPEARDCL